MSLKQYRVTGEKPVKMSKFSHNGKNDKVTKEEVLEKTQKNLEKIAALQDRLYAEGREGVLVLLQAMDAAGKDSTIRRVMDGVNPQGVDVVSFKQPSSEELAHDYLWRAIKALPVRGKMGIFNRSYYEDVLVVRVHGMQKDYKMAGRVVDDDDFFSKRYRQIRHFEEYLYENSYRVVKIFLNVSHDEQKKRFLERIDDAEKNWKFSSSDLKEREHWDEYMAAYEDAINGTATAHSPWYVLPADRKWYTRYLVSEAILEAMEACAPEYPDLPKRDKDNLAACKAQLLAEDGTKPKGETAVKPKNTAVQPKGETAVKPKNTAVQPKEETAAQPMEIAQPKASAATKAREPGRPKGSVASKTPAAKKRGPGRPKAADAAKPAQTEEPNMPVTDKK